MKKRVLAVLLTVVLGVSVLITGCGGTSDSDSDGIKTVQTETSEETEDDFDEEDAVTDNDSDNVNDAAGTEIAGDAASGSGEVLTAGTMISDEDIQEIYTYIKSSIETRYLEPNNIAPENFSWPDEEDPMVWGYPVMLNLHAINNMFSWENSDSVVEDISEEDIEALIEDLNEIDTYSSPEKDILDCVLLGIIDWLSVHTPFETLYFGELWGAIYPSYTTLSENVKFE